jgi:hypothetical protein
VVSIVTCVLVIVHVLVLSGRVFANGSPIFGSSCMVGCSPSWACIKTLFFYPCIETQCSLHFREKKHTYGLDKKNKRITKSVPVAYLRGETSQLTDY